MACTGTVFHAASKRFSQFIDNSDWHMMTNQSLSNSMVTFLLVRDLENVMLRAAAKHFLHQERS